MWRYQCTCGRKFNDPLAMTECDLAGHPEPEVAELATVHISGHREAPEVELVLRSLSTLALLQSVEAITARDRIPFRALLRELAWRLSETMRVRLASLEKAGVESFHGSADAKPRDTHPIAPVSAPDRDGA